MDLLYTTAAMVIAQIVIITPLITSIAHQSLRELWSEYHDLLISMNTSHMQRIKTLLWDARRALLTASLAGFGRAIGEVGAIMIVGGNIDNATRVLTTAIALETSKGDFALALALGFVIGFCIKIWSRKSITDELYPQIIVIWTLCSIDVEAEVFVRCGFSQKKEREERAGQ